MKSVIYRCDRCGRVIPDIPGGHHIQLEKDVSSGKIFRLLNNRDLCSDCFESLKDWLCNYEEKKEGEE